MVAAVAVTRQQIGYWLDGRTLFGRAVSEGNYVMHVALGSELAQIGKRQEAEAYCLEALRLKPDFGRARASGCSWARKAGRPWRSKPTGWRCGLRPDYSTAPFNFGLLRAAHGKSDEAIELYETALRIEPDWAPRSRLRTYRGKEPAAGRRRGNRRHGRRHGRHRAQDAGSVPPLDITSETDVRDAMGKLGEYLAVKVPVKVGPKKSSVA